VLDGRDGPAGLAPLVQAPTVVAGFTRQEKDVDGNLLREVGTWGLERCLLEVTEPGEENRSTNPAVLTSVW
jgi:hypothetical protein